MSAEANIVGVSRRYIGFIGHLVDPNATEADIRAEENQLFAPNVLKIVNGNKLLEGIDNLHVQLMKARLDATPGKILEGERVFEHVPTPEVKYSTTIRFQWSTQKIADGASHIVMATLVFDDEHKITILDEVFNQCGITLHDTPGDEGASHNTLSGQDLGAIE